MPTITILGAARSSWARIETERVLSLFPSTRGAPMTPCDNGGGGLYVCIIPGGGGG